MWKQVELEIPGTGGETKQFELSVARGATGLLFLCVRGPNGEFIEDVQLPQS